MLSRTLNSHSRLVVAISSPQNVSQLVLSRYISNGSFYDRTKSKLFEAMSVYEEIIGIKEVKQAQDSVTNVIYITHSL